MEEAGCLVLAVERLPWANVRNDPGVNAQYNMGSQDRTDVVEVAPASQSSANANDASTPSDADFAGSAGSSLTSTRPRVL